MSRKADELFSKFIRSTGYCEARDWPGRVVECGGPLECSHRHGRACKALRWDARNADCLCRNCHAWFHNNRKEFWEFVEWNSSEEDIEYLEDIKREEHQSFGTNKFVGLTAKEAIRLYGGVSE